MAALLHHTGELLQVLRVVDGGQVASSMPAKLPRIRPGGGDVHEVVRSGSAPEVAQPWQCEKHQMTDLKGSFQESLAAGLSPLPGSSSKTNVLASMLQIAVTTIKNKTLSAP